MNTESIVQKIADEYKLRRRGKLYAGPCPFCGGSSKSDKFNIRPDGGYICRGCGKTGDIITWLRTQENLSCPDAHDRAGRPCAMSATCQAADKCRYGDKTGTNANASRNKNRKPPARPYQHQPEATTTVPVIVAAYPKNLWLAWAEPFAAKCHEQLLISDMEMAYLAGRGIDRPAVIRYGLGLVKHQYQVPKKDIGLPIEQDGKESLWIPEGLLIAINDQGGALHRLRVRRPLASREKFLQDLKYTWIKGSGNLPLVIEPSEQKGSCRGAVIVEAELDGYAIASAHPDVLVIAAGTLHGGVGPELHQRLNQVPVILVALDAEAKSKQAVDAWKRSYRHARYWPTPRAKDAGDFYQQGGDLRAWIESGLPPVAVSVFSAASFAPVSPPSPSSSSVAEKQDAAFSPGRKPTGGEGEEEKESAEKPEYIEVTLSNGKIIYLVDNNGDVWDRLTAEGKPVFSRRELEKLKTATSTLPPEERIKAAMAAIEAKEVFGGYLTRGVCHG
jgi:DNA primase